jgi:hypothetical protein
MNVPDEPMKTRALKLYTYWLLLNAAGQRALEREIEKQHPHHGEAVLSASIRCLEQFLQYEG